MKEIVEKYEQEFKERNEIVKEEEDRQFFLRSENEKLRGELEKLLNEMDVLKKTKDEEVDFLNTENKSVTYFIFSIFILLIS